MTSNVIVLFMGSLKGLNMSEHRSSEYNDIIFLLYFRYTLRIYSEQYYNANFGEKPLRNFFPIIWTLIMSQIVWKIHSIYNGCHQRYLKKGILHILCKNYYRLSRSVKSSLFLPTIKSHLVLSIWFLLHRVMENLDIEFGTSIFWGWI